PTLEFPKVPLPKGRLRFLTTDEESRLLKELDPLRSGRGLKQVESRDREMRRTLQDAYDLVIVLLDTGARYSEVANLEWSQIDVANRTIRLWRSKVQNESVLYMTDRVY